jgi:hypothetical protein
MQTQVVKITLLPKYKTVTTEKQKDVASIKKRVTHSVPLQSETKGFTCAK